MNAIRDYYRAAPLWLPNDVRFRFFKMQLQSGAYIHLRDQIRDTESLRKHLVRYAPLNVWLSCGLFLNPDQVGRKDGAISENRYLGSTLVIDTDYMILSYARRNVLKLWDLLEKMGHTDITCLFSGSRGFHLWCHDWEIRPDGVMSPHEREALDARQRKVIVRLLVENGVKFDKPVLKDTRRVFRVGGSIHGSTGYVCEPVTRYFLEQDDWISRIKKIPLPARRVTLAKKITRKQIPTPREYVLSSVVGTKRQIVSLRYSTYKPNELKMLSEKFDIGSWCVVRGKWIWALSSRALDSPRIEKILKASTVDKDFKSLYARLGYGFFESSATKLDQLSISHDNGPFSMAHNQLLRGMGFELPDRNEIGRAEVVGRTIIG